MREGWWSGNFSMAWRMILEKKLAWIHLLKYPVGPSELSLCTAAPLLWGEKNVCALESSRGFYYDRGNHIIFVCLDSRMLHAELKYFRGVLPPPSLAVEGRIPGGGVKYFRKQESKRRDLGVIYLFIQVSVMEFKYRPRKRKLQLHSDISTNRDTLKDCSRCHFVYYTL